MKIGIFGVGNIGKTLARRLSAAGHDVKVTNSRGPMTIEADVLAFGARAVPAGECASDVDVVILSIPLARIPEVAGQLRKLPDAVTIVDTSNYYPARDGEISSIDGGQVESLWVSEKLGRPVAKAWNSILAASFANKGKFEGASRIALPVAADRERDRDVAMNLVKDTGFEAFNAGALADSWRQQPGSPAYCTDLDHDALQQALGAAERRRLAKRRDLAMAVISERLDGGAGFDPDWALSLNRVLYT